MKKYNKTTFSDDFGSILTLEEFKNAYGKGQLKGYDLEQVWKELGGKHKQQKQKKKEGDK